MDTPAGPMLIHVVVFAVLLLLATGRRLGPARAIYEERRRRPVEFIDAFARLCRASRSSGLGVELVLHHIVESLQRRFGAADGTTVAREASRRGLDPRPLLQTLERARALARGQPSSGDMVRCLRDLEQLRRALLAS
jgi:hypothetical protein